MLSVLIVGCGNIAGGFDLDRMGTAMPFTHAGAYTRHGGFVLKACVEPDTAKREAFMRRWSVSQGFGTMEEVLATEMRFDVISICSPTAAHYQDVLSALPMAPRLIFCEKPVTSSLARTGELIARGAERSVLLAVNYTRRWDPAVVRLAYELRAGVWGAVRSVAGVYNKGVLNNGSHLIDLLHLLLGKLVLCHVSPPIHDMLADDPSIPAVFSAPGDVTVQLNCGNARDFSLFELQLVTEKGVITMEEGGMYWRIRTVVSSPHFSGYRALEEGVRQPGDLGLAMLGAVSQIHEVLLNGGILSSTGANALEAQQLCEELHYRATNKVYSP
ncbi:GFO_IDH_MocA domain-containing protein [Gammaproteobacteria bacterium]